MTEGIEEFYVRATGHPPYPWQERVAEDGLPELLEVPTGCGKTLGTLLGWLYRRRFHPDQSIRRVTPRKLIFTLPMRTLVEQTRDEAQRCLEALGLGGEIELATLMGGEPTSDGWRLYPERESIVVCTLDMGLSGALNRGYATSRYSWPVTFGMLNQDAHWVFDEVQLMGPAAATSRQLQAFRDAFGTALPTSSTWMTATLDLEQLVTVDAPRLSEPLTLTGDPEPPALKQRLDAPRRFGRWLAPHEPPSDQKALAVARAEAIVAAHRPGTRTLAIVNTVATARALHSALERAGFADAILLHSRFRPSDRRAVMDRVLAPPGADGTIVVSTQVIEAGVDLTSATLFTEVAPWPSIVQRAGRCNRYGEISPDDDVQIPRILWDPPGTNPPYDAADVEVTTTTLEGLDGQVLTTRELSAIEVERPARPVSQVIRRADLVRLFDTTPDLGGNDLDVGPWLRAGDDLDVRLCWRELGTDSQPTNRTAPDREELCPAPIADVKTWLRTARAVRLETLDGPAIPGRRRPRRWVPATQDSVRPGQILVIDVKSGGYDPLTGWDPSQKGSVDPVIATEAVELAPVDETMGEDPASTRQKRWVTLDHHLSDVRDELGQIFEAVQGLPPHHVRSTIEAGRWHDLGKAHAVFQDTLQRTLPEPERPIEGGPWAKSGGLLQARHSRPYFRHELASALALLDRAGEVIDRDADRDLVIYLVAAHHGRVRMSIRSFPGEYPSDQDRPAALGVVDGDLLPGGDFAGRTVPGTRLSLDVMELGGTARSWVALATGLRDREDLGLFRLAYLESLVRVADWRVSARYDQAEDVS